MITGSLSATAVAELSMMAASNYYGYTHPTAAAPAPQYSAQPAPVYAHPSTASYTIQPAPTAAHPVTSSYPSVQPAQPAVTAPYHTYQPPHTQTYNYHQPEVPQQPTSAPQTYSYGHNTAPVNSYDSKQYYQTSVTPAQRPATDAYYQTGVKASYSTSTSAYTQPPVQRPVSALKPVPVASSTSSSYPMYPASTSVQQTSATVSTYTPSSTYNSYDSSGYTSTPSYYQPPNPQPPPQRPRHPPPKIQQAPKPLTSSSWSNSPGTPHGNSTYKKPVFQQNRFQKPKAPPKPPQLHYCEVCRISCAGSQTYREHLDGQKHKKKEAAQKAGGAVNNGGRTVQTQLRCELCDISCTGTDAYAAHIRGVKHQKVMKLHTKLGKPIPSTEPVMVTSAPAGVVTASSKPASAPAATPVPSKPASAAPKTPAPAVLSKPAAPAVVKPAVTPAAKSPAAASKAAAPAPVKTEEVKPIVIKTLPVSDDDGDATGPEGDIQPVGCDYVEEVRNDDGKVIRFHCKLCECSFNDPNAKDMHLKGRRHRLQYKKKVNPDLPVEIKPSSRARKLLEVKLRKQKMKSELKRQLEDEQRWHQEMSRRYEEDMYWRRIEDEQIYWEPRHRMAPPPLMGRGGIPVPPLMPMRRPGSPDDRHIMAKHSAIYPSEEELQAIQRIVAHTERALKLVSDSLLEKEACPVEADDTEEKKPQVRLLKGVMRVGILAKGLLLRGDRNVQLILLASKKPTVSILKTIGEQLPEHLESLSEDQYEVQVHPEEASVVIISSKEPKMQVTICLTSPVMREDPVPSTEKEAEEEPPDVLNLSKCLEYLAALRHAKWFQARANGLQSCVIIIRILRDLGQRMPSWAKMSDWTMELIVEKSISSASGQLGPGEALRRVLECVATGILLPDGPGLLDPCEKGQLDVLRDMSKEDREEVTASAQHMLRLLAFRQIHKVLDIGLLTVSKAAARNRKRRHDVSENVEGEAEGKKDKKDSSV
ncbi:hypothetical protein DNTS_027487 [Danionella cerebrum]|uniref:Zinc finger RNA-binding protein n=1 Tax=Danionella cerebrum TaxID=2873325 RepID=A0A553RMC0_9TELE|nr:hypothetical protein DNTS_027487 [Danionella translucida]